MTSLARAFAIQPEILFLDEPLLSNPQALVSGSWFVYLFGFFVSAIASGLTQLSLNALILEDREASNALSRGWKLFLRFLGPNLLIGLILVAITYGIVFLLTVPRNLLIPEIQSVLTSNESETVSILLYSAIGIIYWLLNSVLLGIVQTYYLSTWTLALPASARSTCEGNTRPTETGYDMGAYEYTPDTTPPTGSISINGGAVCTQSADATLTLSVTDPSGVAQMQFSNDNVTWSTPEAYGTSKSWTLSQEYGAKTVYVKFKHTTNNWSAPSIDTIIFPAPGDLNNDGEIDLADFLIALQVTSGLPISSQAGVLCPDSNSDGKIDLMDALHVLQILAGLRE